MKLSNEIIQIENKIVISIIYTHWQSNHKANYYKDL